jgi:hypothetical protein
MPLSDSGRISYIVFTLHVACADSGICCASHATSDERGSSVLDRDRDHIEVGITQVS